MWRVLHSHANLLDTFPVLSKAALLSIFLLPLVGEAQDPVQTDGEKYKVIFENDRVRVLEYRDAPGDRTHQHHHPAFVLYALSAFQRKIHLPDGRVVERAFEPGG